MRLVRIGYGINPTISIGGMEFIRPAGYAEVELNEGDKKDDAINFARKSALEVFVVSANDTQLVMSYTGKYKENFPAAVVKKIIDQIVLAEGVE